MWHRYYSKTNVVLRGLLNGKKNPSYQYAPTCWADGITMKTLVGFALELRPSISLVAENQDAYYVQFELGFRTLQCNWFTMIEPARKDVFINACLEALDQL